MTITNFRDIISKKERGVPLDKVLYAAYETKTRRELCLGVWNSMQALSRAMRITPKSAWALLYRSRTGMRYSRLGFTVHRIVTQEK